MSRMSPLLDKMRWKFLDEGRNVNLPEQRGERGFLFIPIGRSGTGLIKFVISLLEIFNFANSEF